MNLVFFVSNKVLSASQRLDLNPKKSLVTLFIKKLAHGMFVRKKGDSFSYLAKPVYSRVQQSSYSLELDCTRWDARTSADGTATLTWKWSTHKHVARNHRQTI